MAAAIALLPVRCVPTMMKFLCTYAPPIREKNKERAGASITATAASYSADRTANTANMRMQLESTTHFCSQRRGGASSSSLRRISGAELVRRGHTANRPLACLDPKFADLHHGSTSGPYGAHFPQWSPLTGFRPRWMQRTANEKIVHDYNQSYCSSEFNFPALRSKYARSSSANPVFQR